MSGISFGQSGDGILRGDDGTEYGKKIGVVDDRAKVSIGEYDENAPNTAFPVRLPTVTDMTNRVKIAVANQILETTWQYDLQARIYSTRLTGGATAQGPGQKDPAYAQLATTTASGDKAELGTKRYLIYQPFRTHILTMGMILGEGKTNLVKRFGQFTNFNGWFFEQNGSQIFAVYRNNTFEPTGTIETRVERANWNVDPLDGTGPSGLDIDDMLHKALTWVIEYVWHGTQGIQWGIQYFDKLYFVHKLVWSGTEEKTFTRSALLPVRYEMENVGAVASASTWYVGPNSFNIEGGEERKGQRYTASRGTSGRSVNSATVPRYLLAVRPKLTFNGVNNRMSIIPLAYQIFTSDDLFYEVLVQSTTSGGTYTDVDADSGAEFSIDITGASDGYIIDAGYIGGGGNSGGSLARTFESNAFVCVDTYNSNAQLAIVVRAYKLGGNATAYAAINFKEVY